MSEIYRRRRQKGVCRFIIIKQINYEVEEKT